MTLNTDILVALKRKHPPAVAWFATLSDGPLVAGFAAADYDLSALATAPSKVEE
jgi:hypothetical protein